MECTQTTTTTRRCLRQAVTCCRRHLAVLLHPYIAAVCSGTITRTATTVTKMNNTTMTMTMMTMISIMPHLIAFFPIAVTTTLLRRTTRDSHRSRRLLLDLMLLELLGLIILLQQHHHRLQCLLRLQRGVLQGHHGVLENLIVPQASCRGFLPCLVVAMPVRTRFLIPLVIATVIVINVWSRRAPSLTHRRPLLETLVTETTTLVRRRCGCRRRREEQHEAERSRQDQAVVRRNEPCRRRTLSVCRQRRSVLRSCLRDVVVVADPILIPIHLLVNIVMTI